MVSSVSLWYPLNDCFKSSSINSLISPQPPAQSTPSLIFIMAQHIVLIDHHQFKIRIWLPVITHADDIQIDHSGNYSEMFVSVLVSVRFCSFVICHDI